jgi:hypothetical protein
LENPRRWHMDVENPDAQERLPDPIEEIFATDR